jgi:ribonuclease R
LAQLGEQCSMTERRADEATRDVVNWLKCEYMRERVGDTFPGVITAVTGFGIFVELTDIYVEGLVHVTALPGDYYHFDPVHHRLSGERTGRSFRLGDTVEVLVARVDLDERKIDFEMVKDPLDVAAEPRRDAGKRKAARGKARGGKDVVAPSPQPEKPAVAAKRGRAPGRRSEEEPAKADYEIPDSAPIRRKRAVGSTPDKAALLSRRSGAARPEPEEAAELPLSAEALRQQDHLKPALLRRRKVGQVQALAEAADESPEAEATSSGTDVEKSRMVKRALLSEARAAESPRKTSSPSKPGKGGKSAKGSAKPAKPRKGPKADAGSEGSPAPHKRKADT